MLWVVTAVTFIITVVVAVGLFIVLTPKEKQVADRLSRLMEPETPVNEAEGFSQKQKERVRDSLASLGKMLPEAGGKQATSAQLKMVRAGFRGPDAMLVLRGAKVLLPLLLLSLVFFTGVYKFSPLFILIG